MKLLKKTTREIGGQGEDNARNFLKEHGIKIRESNFRCKFGEIDIIGDDGNSLLFIEVKTRKRTDYGQPFETVTPQKQKKIILAAQRYLQKHPKLANKACRFDVISIVDDKIDWIQDAFNTNF